MNQYGNVHLIQKEIKRPGRPAPLTNHQPPTTSHQPVIPKEHGAWALLYGPFLVTAAAFGGFQPRIFLFLIALTTLFLAHEPLAKLVGSRGREIGRQQLQRWKQWLSIYVLLTVISGGLLLALYRLWLLIPIGFGIACLLALHLFLIRRRQERLVASEILGVFALTAGAPAAYYVITGRIDPTALLLWGLNILYFSSGIFHVKMVVSRSVGKPEAGSRTLHSILYHLFAAGVIILLARQGWVPYLVILAFTPIVLRTCWALVSTPKRLNFKRIGYSEVAYTMVFVACMVAAFR